MEKIVTFGELMLRLMPQGYNRIVQANNFNAEFGGAEANVAVSLANFGMDSLYVSRLPQNQIGQSALNSLRRFGVNTEFIARSADDRMGIYFLEKGAAQRSSLCIYDRKNSAFANSSPGDYDWNKILRGALWLHVTGITPALSKNCAFITLEACRKAKERGITVSCDLNYRSKLWTKQKARAFMKLLAPSVDVLITNEDDALNVFGIKTEHTDTESGVIDAAAYKKTMLALHKKFAFKKIAVTLRQSESASVNSWSGIYFDGKDFWTSRRYKINLVERVGSGDAFAAGLIYALCKKFSGQKTVDFAAAASALKHSIDGDYNMVSAEEVMQLAASAGTGRIKR